jgi:hemerythrin
MSDMASISWKDEYRIGIPAVDHEHRELIAQINEILAQAQQPELGAEVVDCLGELHASISAHFALEENVMRERNYDGYTDHKADHERLLDDIHDLTDEADDPLGLDLEGFSERLSQWFLGHFSSHDARLHKRLGTF